MVQHYHHSRSAAAHHTGQKQGIAHRVVLVMHDAICVVTDTQVPQRSHHAHVQRPRVFIEPLFTLWARASARRARRVLQLGDVLAQTAEAQHTQKVAASEKERERREREER